MPVSFTARCPLGQKCGKMGKTLGTFSTREEALDKVAHHLHASANHEGFQSEQMALHYAEKNGIAEEWPYDDDDNEECAAPSSKKARKQNVTSPAQMKDLILEAAADVMKISQTLQRIAAEIPDM